MTRAGAAAPVITRLKRIYGNATDVPDNISVE